MIAYSSYHWHSHLGMRKFIKKVLFYYYYHYFTQLFDIDEVEWLVEKLFS